MLSLAKIVLTSQLFPSNTTRSRTEEREKQEYEDCLLLAFRENFVGLVSRHSWERQMSKYYLAQVTERVCHEIQLFRPQFHKILPKLIRFEVNLFGEV